MATIVKYTYQMRNLLSKLTYIRLIGQFQQGSIYDEIVMNQKTTFIRTPKK